MTAGHLALTTLVIVGLQQSGYKTGAMPNSRQQALGVIIRSPGAKSQVPSSRLPLIWLTKFNSQTQEQLGNVGTGFLSREMTMNSQGYWYDHDVSSQSTLLILAIELYDAQSKALIWQAEAIPALSQGDSRASLIIVDRTITKMFEHFPNHLNGWMSLCAAECHTRQHGFQKVM